MRLDLFVGEDQQHLVQIDHMVMEEFLRKARTKHNLKEYNTNLWYNLEEIYNFKRLNSWDFQFETLKDLNWFLLNL